MPDFRKKPVVIQAVQWHGANVQEIVSLAATGKQSDVDANIAFDLRDGYPAKLTIKTLEGDLTAELNDWIIKGVKGELYPCKPDIFAATYDAVEQPAAMVTAG